jgi:hypothetical protein
MWLRLPVQREFLALGHMAAVVPVGAMALAALQRSFVVVKPVGRNELEKYFTPLPRVLLREVGPPAVAAAVVVPGAVAVPGLPPPGHPPLPARWARPVLPLASPVLPLQAKKLRQKEKKEMGDNSSSDSSSASDGRGDSHSSDQKCKYIQCAGAGMNVRDVKETTFLKALQEMDCTIWATMRMRVMGAAASNSVKVLLEVGHRRLPQAMDLIAQRLRELRMEKSDGSSWEKASLLSLLPTALPPNLQTLDTAFVL